MTAKNKKPAVKANKRPQKLKTGDEIIVLAGKDKGKTGKLLRCLNDGKVLVEGINMVSKHVRPNPNTNEKGGVQKKERPLHHSNVALLNPLTNKADRVYFKTVEISDGRMKKVRVYKSNNETVDA